MLRSMKVCVEGKSSLTDKWKVCEQTMNQSEKILEIKDLCVEFQTVEGTVKAINHLNYTLHKGEKLGIVGESGSGKSVSSLGIMQLIPNPPHIITGCNNDKNRKNGIHTKNQVIQHFAHKISPESLSAIKILYYVKNYSSQLLTVRGNGITSLILPIPVRYITHLSKPRPKPA